jgi:hypothetical protein
MKPALSRVGLDPVAVELLNPAQLTLSLQGTGMDKAAFKLVDRVTAARVTRDGAGQNK